MAVLAAELRGHKMCMQARRGELVTWMRAKGRMQGEEGRVRLSDGWRGTRTPASRARGSTAAPS